MGHDSRLGKDPHDVARGSEVARELMQQGAETAVEFFRRQQLLEATNAAYAALRAAPEGWQDLQVERNAWDATLADGLEGEEE